MLLIGLTSLLIAIPLYSSTITPTLLTRITAIILLFSALLSFNRLYVQAIGSGLGLYSGLFHVTTVTQAMEIFLYVVGGLILLPWASEENSQNNQNNYTGMGTYSAVLAKSSDSNAVEFPVSNGNNSSLSGGSIAEYPLIIIFTTIGASFLICSADLVSMYLSIELQSFAVYILAAIYRNSESATSAGLKYFLLGALSSALILLGSSLIYAYTGLTHFEGIYMITDVASTPAFTNRIGGPVEGRSEHNLSLALFSSHVNEVGNAVVLGMLIIGVGFLFKVAAAPFHNWAPDVYDGVPTIVTTWLTVMPKISIFVFLLELSGFSFGSNILDETTISSSLYSSGHLDLWKNLLLTTSLLSLVIGTVVGLAQYRLKRLLAFSTISHVGFLLLALSVNSEESITSFLFYLIQYSITNLNTFFVVLAFGYLSSQTSLGKSLNLPQEFGMNLTARTQNRMDISLISQLKGQFIANPILGLSLALCLFSMAGIPPLVGFFAKYRVLYSAIENGYYFLALVGILASVISAAYYLRIIRVVFMNEPDSVIRSTDSDLSYRSETNRNGGMGIIDNLTATHSYVVAVLTLLITLFIFSPSLVLNSSNLLALSLFTA